MKKLILLLMLIVGLCSTAQAQIYIDVDVAVVLYVNKHPLQSDTGVIDEGILYDEGSMDLVWHFTTCAGATTSTDVTLTTSDDQDWAHTKGGIYTCEIPTSAETINNTEEGTGYFTGDCDGVLPWSSYSYIFRKASHNDVDIDSGAAGDAKEELLITDWSTAYDSTLNMFNSDMEAVDGDTGAATTLETTFDTATAADAWEASWVNTTWAANIDDMYDGTGYAGGTIQLTVDAVEIDGNDVTADNLHEFFGKTSSVGAYENFEDMFDTTGISISDAFNDNMLQADIETYSQTGAEAAATAIVDEWESQSNTDPTGFHVNLEEINGVVTQLEMLMDASTTIDADDDLTGIVVDKSVLSHIMTEDADTSFYEAGHDSLYAIRHRGDRAWTTGVGASPSESYQILSITRTIGDADGGDNTKVNIVDADTFDTGETAAGTYLEVDATFSATNGEDAASVNIWGYYAGGAGHYMIIQAYNYIDSTFEEIGTMGDDDVVSYYSFQMSHAHIDPANGNMAVKFLHAGGSGITSHVLVIDKIIVTTTSESLLDANVVLILADTEAWDSANKAKTLLTGGTSALSTLTTSDNIGINWADIDNKGATVALTGTTVTATLETALSTTVGTTITSTRIFNLAAGVANSTAYRYNIISVQDADDSHWEVRLIIKYIGSTKMVTLDKALTFTPVNGDVVEISKVSYQAPQRGRIY